MGNRTSNKQMGGVGKNRKERFKNGRGWSGLGWGNGGGQVKRPVRNLGKGKGRDPKKFGWVDGEEVVATGDSENVGEGKKKPGAGSRREWVSPLDRGRIFCGGGIVRSQAKEAPSLGGADSRVTDSVLKFKGRGMAGRSVASGRGGTRQ